MEILFHPLKTIPLLLVASGLAFGQGVAPGCATISPDAAKRQFDVASMRHAEPTRPFDPKPYNWTGGPGTNDPGRFTAAHTTLSYLIMRAWGNDLDQLKGPLWLNDTMSGGYDISATMPVSTTAEEFCGMLRNLLTERLHLTFHYEKQSRPGYELTVLPGGPKFKEFVPDPAASGVVSGTRGLDADGFPVLSPSQRTARMTINSRTGVKKESLRNNMEMFVRFLPGDINEANGIPGPGWPMPRVVDKTGLTGVYDMRLEFAGVAGSKPAPDGAAAPAASDPVDAGPNIFVAFQQQLGLKLTKVADVPVDVMIVDHVDQMPTEN